MIKQVILFLAIPILGFCQSIDQKADELLSAYTNLHKFSGNVLIAQKGKIIFEKSYGYADLQTKRPNTAETEFRAGSLTKMFTSTAILQLANDHKLNLNDAVSKYVPGFPYGDQIKIQDLLSHTSGIHGNTNPASSTLNELVEQFKLDSLAFVPGSKFEYNNFNYMLLSYIAQKVTGKEFPALLQQNVLEKASMVHSGLDTPNRNSQNKATGYVIKPSTLEWVPANGEDVTKATGAGALYTTTHDLLKWSEVVASSSVLPGDLLQKAWTPVQGNYGLGWTVEEKNGRLEVGHNGSIQGYLASFMKFPKEDITIIFLSNFGEANGAQIKSDLEAVFFNEPYTLPVEKKEITFTAEELKKYAGEYKQNENFSIVLSIEGNKLYGLAQGDAERMEFTPQSETKFFLKGPDIEVEFQFENNQVAYMLVKMGGVQKFKKVS